MPWACIVFNVITISSSCHIALLSFSRIVFGILLLLYLMILRFSCSPLLHKQIKFLIAVLNGRIHNRRKKIQLYRSIKPQMLHKSKGIQKFIFLFQFTEHNIAKENHHIENNNSNNTHTHTHTPCFVRFKIEISSQHTYTNALDLRIHMGMCVRCLHSNGYNFRFVCFDGNSGLSFHESYFTRSVQYFVTDEQNEQIPMNILNKQPQAITSFSAEAI